MIDCDCPNCIAYNAGLAAGRIERDQAVVRGEQAEHLVERFEELVYSQSAPLTWVMTNDHNSASAWEKLACKLYDEVKFMKIRA